MARTVRNTKIDTRSARAKLSIRREPYWISITPGYALGYRKNKNGGSWIAKRYSPDASPKRRYLAIGPADDVMDADGVAALSFAQAQEKAREWFRQEAREVHGASAAGSYTVNDALDAYVQKLNDEGKPSARDSRCRADALIRPAIGRVKLSKLTSERLRRFLRELAATPPRARTKRGKKQNYRYVLDTEEAHRKRRSSANRTWSVLRAALNHAFIEGMVESDHAWRRVKPFRGVEAARTRYLTIEESQRLINAASPEFRPLVTAALLTGARYGELARLDVGDFDPVARTILIRRSKSGRARHVPLTDEGVVFFMRIAAGREADEPMLIREDGSRWGECHQIRPMREACEAAKIAPPVSFHCLRHSFASLAIMNGAPLMVVASSLGHSSTRMVERHYGHISNQYIAERIRQTAPRFNLKQDERIVPLRRKRKGLEITR